MSNIFNKLSASFFLFTLVFSLFLSVFNSPVLAQSPWYDQSFGEWKGKVHDTGNANEIFGERYTRAQVQWIVYSLADLIISPTTDANQIMVCISTKPLASCISEINALLAMDVPTEQSHQNLGEALLQERPISAVTYVKDVFRNLKIIPEAQAQTTGFGFTALNPVLDLWKASRNITYTLFILIAIIMAFMIMFRVKLSPQTVVTVQSALPKLAISLILITFSYAIAGLLIDLMYVFIGLLGLLLSQATQGEGLIFQQRTPVQFFDLLTQGPAVSDIHLGIFGFIIKYWVGALIVMFGLFIGADSIFVKIGAIIGLLLTLIAIIVLLWNWMKIFFMLLKTVAQLLLQTIVAPLQIMLGTVIPSLGFNTWFRAYIANLAVFPVTGFLFVLSSIFLSLSIVTLGKGMDIGSLLGFVGLGFVDNATEASAAAWPPLLNLGDAETTLAMVYFGVSFVIITIIPKTAEQIEAIIKGGKFSYGAALNEAINPLGIKNLIAESAGTFIGNELYNPRGNNGEGSGLATSLVNQIRAGLGSRSRGNAGGGPRN